MHRSKSLLVSSLLLLLTPFSATRVLGQAPPLTPLDEQFQVNSYTTESQGGSTLALDARGNFVIAWGSSGSPGTDSDSFSVHARRFASDGTALGGDFQVNTYTTDLQRGPQVAAAADGDFVVVWRRSVSGDTSVQAQLFASDGAAIGDEFQVNSQSTVGFLSPSVAMDAQGDFVVVWTSYPEVGLDLDVQAQRFSSSGTFLGGQFRVNTSTPSAQWVPSVAMDGRGDFVVVWAADGSSGTDSDGVSIQGRRFASDGTALGGEFQVNSYTTGEQRYPNVAGDATGGFVVAWRSDGSYGSDDDAWSIQAQRYASDGSPAGGEFQVNSYTTGNQDAATVAMDATGDFVVAWIGGGYGPDSDGPQAQRYASDGTPIGGQFQVHSYISGLQYGGFVALDAQGDLVATWSSFGSSETDTDRSSVQAQRFSGSTCIGPNVIVNGGADDGLGGDGTTILPIPGWDLQQGEPTATEYDTAGDWPGAASPGPRSRGANFFSGGQAATSVTDQVVDLGSHAAAFDTGQASFSFCAFLGGRGRIEDQAVVEVEFLNEDAQTLATASLGPTSPTLRSRLTGLIHHWTAGTVPQLTRSARVTITMTREEGVLNHGYVDSVHLGFSSIFTDGFESGDTSAWSATVP